MAEPARGAPRFDPSHTLLYTHVKALTHTHSHTHTRTHTRTHTCTHTRTHTHMHTHAHTHTRTHTYTNTYTHAHTRAHTHTCTHTHLWPAQRTCVGVDSAQDPFPHTSSSHICLHTCEEPPFRWASVSVCAKPSFSVRKSCRACSEVACACACVFCACICVYV